MAIFRFQRASLEESLKTSVIVKDTKELLELLATWYEKECGALVSRETMYQWQIHIDKQQKFDDRCGWYTHLVSYQVRNSDFFAVGFLSEPLDKWDDRT